MRLGERFKSEDRLKSIMDNAESYARLHRVDLALELVNWSNSGILKNGYLRQLAEILSSISTNQSLVLAEKIATQAILRAFVKQPN